jgi:hypothetical protein
MVSFLPKVILLNIEGIYQDFWEDVSDVQRLLFTFFYQMYIINNIVNPFIYAFMDSQFRDDTKEQKLNPHANNPASVKMTEINHKYENTRKIHRLLTNQNPGFLYMV